jgi:hypothetical protein
MRKCSMRSSATSSPNRLSGDGAAKGFLASCRSRAGRPHRRARFSKLNWVSDDPRCEAELLSSVNLTDDVRPVAVS